MLKKKSKLVYERKMFINSMNSWFSNFLIEEFRTDYLPDSKIKTIIMGTIDPSGGPLPKLFEPKETYLEVGYNYSQEVFENDILIFNLDDSYLPEVDFVIRGLQNIKIENEKILIIVSNIMTWAETPLKTFTEEEIKQEGFNEEEVPEIIEEEEKKENNINIENEEDKKSLERKESKESEKQMKENEDKINKDKPVKKPTKNSINGPDKENNKENNKENTKENNKENTKDNKENTKENIKEDTKENNKTEKGMKTEENKNITDTQRDQKLESQAPEEENHNEEIEEENESKKNIVEEEVQKEPEKPKIKTYYYKETEYQKRSPNSRYFYYKILETLALSNTNPKVKTYIICPGFIYGCGEDFFFDYFRLAWMGHLPYIPIVGEGDNFLPTIHILDLVQVIKRIIEKKPNQRYIFACDKTKNPTLKNILKSIGNCIGGLDIKLLKEFNIENIDIPNYTELKIDLRIKPSIIFEDEQKKSREDIEDYQSRKFPWHCEFGIPDNIDILREEFNLYRNLKPIKIVITGPPCGGKTTLCKFISDKYKLNYYQINQFCDWVKGLNNKLTEEANIHLQEIEENITKALYDYDHRKNKRKTDPPLDTSQLRKFSSEFIGKILKERLNIGVCATKGYILDNYPKTYEDCVNMFCTTFYDKEKKDGYIIDKKYIPDSVIIINNFSEENLRNKLKKNEEYSEKQFDLDNRFNRRLNLYKQQNEYNEENKKLIQDFYKENNIDIFFLDEQKYMSNKEEEEKKLIEYLERKGPIDNYSRLHDEDEVIPYIESAIDENTNQINEEQIILNGNLIYNNNNFGLNNKVDVIKEVNENNPINNVNNNNTNTNNKMNQNNNSSKNNIMNSISLNNNNISTKSKKKEDDELKHISDIKPEEEIEKFEEEKEYDSKDENKINELNISNNDALNEFLKEEKKLQDKLKDLEEREKKLLEKKSEVLRRYLSENVMPLLAKGILSVCQTMPDDPVDALANFLLDNSFNLQKESNDKLKINDFEKIVANDNDDNDDNEDNNDKFDDE